MRRVNQTNWGGKMNVLGKGRVQELQEARALRAFKVLAVVQPGWRVDGESMYWDGKQRPGHEGTAMSSSCLRKMAPATVWRVDLKRVTLK